jgi:hypothetical protein
MIMMYDCIAIFCERLYERMRVLLHEVNCMAKEPRISIQYSARLANGDKRFLMVLRSKRENAACF